MQLIINNWDRQSIWGRRFIIKAEGRILICCLMCWSNLISSFCLYLKWTLMDLFLTSCVFFPPKVPDDVFAPDFVWKGSYDYKGQKQPMTLTVTSFNATTGKVNVTLTDSSMEFLLSGESSINHLSSTSSPPPPLPPLLLPLDVTSIYFEGASCQSVNHQMISCMRVEINYWL